MLSNQRRTGLQVGLASIAALTAAAIILSGVEKFGTRRTGRIEHFRRLPWRATTTPTQKAHSATSGRVRPRWNPVV
jgi:hypothetical protein